MTHSLRRRLVWGTVGATTLVLLCAGLMLERVLRHWLQQEFDAGLAGRAALLATLVEQEESDLEFDFDYRSMPEFAAGPRQEFFQIWRENGSVLARSQSLRQEDLVEGGPLPHWTTLALPDGRRGRMVAIAATPRVESRRATRPERITVALARETAGVDALMTRVRAGLLAVGLAAVAISAFVLARVVRSGLRPLNNLAAQIGGLQPETTSPSSRVRLDTPPHELVPVVEQMNLLLERVEAAMGREKAFTAEVAHELRTPLAGLRSTIEVSLSRERDGEAHRADLTECLRITSQMQHMVGNLLCMARLEGGIMSIRPTKLHVNELLRECWQAFEWAAGEKSVDLRWSGSEETEVITDRDVLRQILVNLLDNAVSYVDRGGRIEIDSRPSPVGATVTIINTGSRLAPEQVERVFDRFWRGDSARHGTGVHCGLGLALTKMLAERLNARVGVTSEVGGCFRVHLEIASLTSHI